MGLGGWFQQNINPFSRGNIGDKTSSAIGGFNQIRDPLEAAASVAGNYYLPGSGYITGPMTSKGSQGYLNSSLGQMAMLASGGAGAWNGNMGNWGRGWNALTNSSPEGWMEGTKKAWSNPTEFFGNLGYSEPAASYGTGQTALTDAYSSGMGAPMSIPGGGASMSEGAGTPFSFQSMFKGMGKPNTLFNLAQTGLMVGAMGQMAGMGNRAGDEADPLGSQRGYYGQRLRELETDPSRVTQLPGYGAGLQAVQRSLAAQGYEGSGNMMAALQEYGGNAYNTAMQRYAELAGAQFNPASAAQLRMQGGQYAMDALPKILQSGKSLYNEWGT